MFRFIEMSARSNMGAVRVAGGSTKDVSSVFRRVYSPDPALRMLTRSFTLSLSARSACSCSGTMASGRAGFSIPRPWKMFSGGSRRSSEGILLQGTPSKDTKVTSVLCRRKPSFPRGACRPIAIPEGVPTADREARSAPTRIPVASPCATPAPPPWYDPAEPSSRRRTPLSTCVTAAWMRRSSKDITPNSAASSGKHRTRNSA
mmetsp:Transcript_24583/g.61217  ORF Transcript_24583/g.61217 Transcript_24583/m.61217 type:complete len:203 (-) Transcript_24583:648-1256(-)